MRKGGARSSALAGLAAIMAIGAVAPQAQAQDSSQGSISGSIGGSIGGSIDVNPPPAHRTRPRPRSEDRSALQTEMPARQPRRQPRASGGGFDGAWQVSASGECSGAGSSQYTVSGGRIIGPYASGRVSPSGAVSTVGSINGLSVVSSGRLTGTSGQGIYQQSDGCSGPWIATKL